MNEWMTEKKPHRIDSSVPFPWLTVEITLWGLLLVIALGLRLFRLDAVPLSAAEARGALTAWRFAHGQGAPTAVGDSPVLFSGQWFTFLIFGANELTARLLPALVGTALALTPALLRQQLGRLGALAAGALLALSPTALTLSRTASGHILVALGALLCTGALWHYVESQRINEVANTGHATPLQDTQYVAFGIALMLTSSPLAYSAMLSLGSALLLLILTDPASRDQLQKGWIAFRATPNLVPYTLGTLVVSFVLLSTAFAWHIGGLAEAADLLPQWLDGFVRWPDSLSPGYPVLILVIYEPLILLTGGVGATLLTASLWRAFGVSAQSNAQPSRGLPLTNSRPGGTPLFMGLWSIAALALALIRPGHGPGDVLLVLLPLACLGGLALDALIESLRRWGDRLSEGLYLIISAPLWAWLAINLVTYSSQPGQHTQLNLLFVTLSLPTYLSLAVATILLLLIMAAGMGLLQGFGPTLRGLGLSTTLVLLLFTIATTWGVSQSRPADPREPLILEPTAIEVRLLKESLARLSNERQGDAHVIDLTVLTDDPALAWVLRDFQGARFADPWTGTPLSTSAVIAPPSGLGTSQLEGAYIGQSFPLRRRWETDGLACRWNPVQAQFGQVQQLDCSSLVQWLIFRHSLDQPAEERVTLWVRQDKVVDW